MNRCIINSVTIFFLSLFFWGIIMTTNASAQQTTPVPSETSKELKISDIKVGDNVVCVDFHESVVDDIEYGPSTRRIERVYGRVTEIKGDVVFIYVLEPVTRLNYMHNGTAWVADSIMNKPPRTRKGVIFKCKPKKETYKDSTSDNKWYITLENK